MQKHIYRAITMVLVFIAAIVILVGNMEERTFRVEATTEMSDASFPLLTIESRDYKMNPLQGYSVNMDVGILRDSLTPLDAEQSFYVIIHENETKVKRLLYEVWKTDSNSMLDSGSISALEQDEEGKKRTKIKIKAELEQEKEYAVKMTIVTATGKKVRFYTRVKYLPQDYLAEKLDFALDFHKILLDKKAAESIRGNLESDNTMANDSLAYVNIHSSFDVVTWAGLKPEVITDPVPVLKEINESTAAVQLKYMVKAKTPSGTERYFVTEFIRVQYTASRMYLLAYERTMEAEFDTELTSLKKSELKVGISAQEDMDIAVGGENSRLCFVRSRELWYYNIAENTAVKVFSFRNADTKDKRELYDQHEIRVLNMDDSGNIDFMVYGYMNRGVYEGRVGIVLYRFFAGENRVEEMVYIPLETSYQVLKEDLDRFSYVSRESIFYFSIYNVIYSYNIITKKMELVAEDIKDDSYVIPKEKGRIVWQSSSDIKESGHLVVMDLENRKKKEIPAPSGSVIRILGTIDDNIIYGFAKKKDLSVTTDGTPVVPLYQILISDLEGNVRKSYEEKGIYIFSIFVEENVIRLERREKGNQGVNADWLPVEDDHILNYTSSQSQTISISVRITDAALKELYITLPKGYTLSELPSVLLTRNTVIHSDTTLRLAVTQNPPEKYYVYAYGEIYDTSLKASEAVTIADEKMGAVLNQKNQIVWERGRNKKSGSVTGINMVKADGALDSIHACIRMILGYRYVTVDNKALAAQKGAITELLDFYLDDNAINLTGCTLSEALFYVGRQQPVIAMQNRTDAVLITAYDEYSVQYFDPLTGKEERLGISAAQMMFEEAGNVFVSYID